MDGGGGVLRGVLQKGAEVELDERPEREAAE
jgi:hypothetical protein